MKVVVFAYHNMGLAGLQALERAGYEIACIFSHEDDPDENCWFGSVQEWAAERAIPVYCPADVNQPEWMGRIAALRAGDDLLLLLSPDAPGGDPARSRPGARTTSTDRCLPAYRGRCPVNWVLVHGETTDRGYPASHGDEGRCRGYRRPEAVPIETDGYRGHPVSESSATRRGSPR